MYLNKVKIAKMINQVLMARLGSSSFQDIFLKIYPY